MGSPGLSYHGLRMHVPAYTGSFEGMPFSDSHTILDARPSAGDMFIYCEKFVEENGLAKNIHLNHIVNEVHYSTTTRKATLLVKELESAPRHEGPFDLIVYCSMTRA